MHLLTAKQRRLRDLKRKKTMLTRVAARARAVPKIALAVAAVTAAADDASSAAAETRYAIAPDSVISAAFRDSEESAAACLASLKATPVSAATRAARAPLCKCSSTRLRPGGGGTASPRAPSLALTLSRLRARRPLPTRATRASTGPARPCRRLPSPAAQARQHLFPVGAGTVRSPRACSTGYRGTCVNLIYPSSSRAKPKRPPYSTCARACARPSRCRSPRPARS